MLQSGAPAAPGISGSNDAHPPASPTPANGALGSMAPGAGLSWCSPTCSSCSSCAKPNEMALQQQQQYYHQQQHVMMQQMQLAQQQQQQQQQQLFDSTSQQQQQQPKFYDTGMTQQMMGANTLEYAGIPGAGHVNECTNGLGEAVMAGGQSQTACGDFYGSWPQAYLPSLVKNLTQRQSYLEASVVDLRMQVQNLQALLVNRVPTAPAYGNNYGSNHPMSSHTYNHAAGGPLTLQGGTLQGGTSLFSTPFKSMGSKGPIEGIDGNWRCLACNNINYVQRSNCNRCQGKPARDQPLTTYLPVSAELYPHRTCRACVSLNSP